MAGLRAARGLARIEVLVVVLTGMLLLAVIVPAC